MARLPHSDAVRIGVRSTLVGVLVNTLLAAIKGITGVAGNSYALIADAIESVFDVAGSLIVLGGLTIAARPADENHPYGHGKAEPLAASVVAITLCAAAVGIAIQSVREIVVPHHAPAPYTLVVLVLVVLTKETLFRFVLREGRRANSTAVTTDAWHHRSDAFTSAAAFFGISIALIGGEGYEMADDVAALFASGLIAVNGGRLLKAAIREVMDTAPPAELEAAVRLNAARVEGVTGVEKCVVRKMGLSYFVDLHVEVNGDITVRDGHTIAHGVKDAVRSANPGVQDVLVHVEPEDPDRA